MNNLTIGRFPALSYAGSEAINTLCTNLSFSGENVRKIMLTSCHASEGKSFVSMNVMRKASDFNTPPFFWRETRFASRPVPPITVRTVFIITTI